MKNYARVIELPKTYEVFDFSTGAPLDEVVLSEYGIGRYNEDRPNMYTGFQSKDSASPRTIHMGIDIFAPVGEAVYSFGDGTVIDAQNNNQSGDYGYTVTAAYEHEGRQLYALYGHLGATALKLKPGQEIHKSEQIGEIGSYEENGNWPPHVHFQLSWVKPEVCDMPGVVSKEQHEQALQTYPDPQIVLGKLY